MKKVFTTISSLCLLSTFFQLPANAVQLLVPAYFDPSTPDGNYGWNTLIDTAASGTPITAILNPNTGAAGTFDRDRITNGRSFLETVKAFEAAGGKVIGYVPSGYVGISTNPTASCQPTSAADVVSCAQAYKNLGYTLNGIFIDEVGIQANTQSNLSPSDVTAFYASVYNGIKAIDPTWTVFGNSGSDTVDYLSQGVVNTLITFEDLASKYGSTTPAPFTTNPPASQFGNILIESSSGFDVASALALAQSRNVEYIYVTDDTLPNPYDRLPTYFAQEVQVVNQLNSQKVPEPADLLGTFVFAAFGIKMVVNRRKKLAQSPDRASNNSAS